MNLMDFLSYWWGNICRGWSIGNNVVGVLQVLLGIAVAFVWIRNKRKQEVTWEPAAVRWLSVAFVAVFLVTTVFVAPYLDRKELASQQVPQKLEVIDFIRQAHDKTSNDLVRALSRLDEAQKLLEIRPMAEFNVFGNKSASIGEMPVVRTPVNNWCRSFVKIVDGKPEWTFDETTEALCREAISKLSQFPFAHFFLAATLKRKNDPEWRAAAGKALDLFGMTTTVQGHHPHHDFFLSETRRLLSEK